MALLKMTKTTRPLKTWQDNKKIRAYGAAHRLNVILLPKFFWPTERKNWACDREKLLKYETEGQEFAKFLGSLQQFIQTVKGQNNFW